MSSIVITKSFAYKNGPPPKQKQPSIKLKAIDFQPYKKR